MTLQEPKDKEAADKLAVTIRLAMDELGISADDAAIVLVTQLRNRMLRDNAGHEEWLLLRDKLVDLVESNITVPGIVNPTQFNFSTGSN